MQIGAWFIPTYTVRVTGSLIPGVLWVWWAGLRQGLSPRRIATLLWVAALGTLLGGRSLYVVQHAAYFAQQPGDSLQLWRVGGLSGPGAWIGGAVAVALWARYAGFSWFHAYGLLTPAALALSAGAWWGCFDVGCSWGREVAGTVPAWQRWLVVEAPDLYRTLTPRYAVQWLAAGTGALLALAAAWRPKFWGPVVGLYLALLALLTFLRGDPVLMVGGLRLDMLLYGGLAGSAVISACLFLRTSRTSRTSRNGAADECCGNKLRGSGRTAND